MVSYVVDGDNLIGWSGGPHPEDDRRAEVVRRVHALCARTDSMAVVVFDRARASIEGTERVSVRVAERGATADELIRALVDAASDPSAVTVVTSDKPLYSYARTRGAAVLRAHEWKRLERGRPVR